MSGESPLLVVSTHGRREKRALWGLSLSLSLFLDLFILFIYFWLRWVFVAAPGLFSNCSERGLLFVAVPGLLTAVASLVAEHGLYP